MDNARENSVRPLALGRKNHLFCGNHDAAENAAIIYTFMGCCKLAQVDVRKWLSQSDSGLYIRIHARKSVANLTSARKAR